MNLSPRWIGLLAGVGIEAKHWSTLGASNAPDAEIMAYARVNDYVVLTPMIWTSARSLPPRTARNPASCKFARKMSVLT
ncbi:MAG: DUF5615 family PIN-like protein [Methyloglobulus sp.]